MRRHDDDLSPFRNDPVYRALTGPASADELYGEAEALAAYRASASGRTHRRLVARVGTSGTVMVAAVALSGGAAAAYSASFPAPVQRVLHAAFAPLDVPAPAPPKPVHRTDAVLRPPAGPTPMSPAPASSPTDRPSPRTSSGTPSAKPTSSASPTATPSSIVGVPPLTSPTPTATPTPTSTATGRVPLAGGTLTATVSADKVVAPGSVTITGLLSGPRGSAVGGYDVTLAEHLTGERGWSPVQVLPTTSNGEVVFTVDDVAQNARFELRAGHHVHSTVIKVVVVPAITVHVTPAAAGDRTTTVTATVGGAEAGDVVVLKRSGKHASTQRASLDSTGTATFTVPVSLRRTLTYRLVVSRTPAHAVATATITVAPPAGSPKS